MSEKQLKDVFHQSADGGIPAHWTVMYISNGWTLAEYFETETECWDFVANDFKLIEGKE